MLRKNFALRQMSAVMGSAFTQEALAERTSREGLDEMGRFDADRRRRMLLPFAMLQAERGRVDEARALLAESGQTAGERLATLAARHVEAVVSGRPPDAPWVPTNHAERLLVVLEQRWARHCATFVAPGAS